MVSYYLQLLILWHFFLGCYCASALQSAAVPPPSKSRPLDVVIYGATGFTGKLAAKYMHENYATVKYALAGRSRSKLEQLRDELGCDDDDDIPLLIADYANVTSLEHLVQSTKVVVNYAGTPFGDKALPLVGACARYGTCYADITGEVPFQRASYDLYHDLAVASGALVLHACGYDSIPSDVGAWLAANAMEEEFHQKCTSLELVSRRTRGGASGGTLATALALLFHSKDIPGVNEAKQRGCYGLDPKKNPIDPEDTTPLGPDTSDTVGFVQYDPISESYVMPFVMASANAPVVRKSNALLGRTNCTYREVQAVDSWWKGVQATLSLYTFGVLLTLPPTRWFLTNYVLPKPGEGPTVQDQETGYFESQVYAVGSSSSSSSSSSSPPPPITVATVAYDRGDPGYKATALMSMETALCLALRPKKDGGGGGVLTPATGLGQDLVERLQRAGLRIVVESKPPTKQPVNE